MGTIRLSEQLPRENVQPPVSPPSEILQQSDLSHDRDCSGLISTLRAKIRLHHKAPDEDEEISKQAETIFNEASPQESLPSTRLLHKVKRHLKSLSPRIYKSKPIVEQPLGPRTSRCEYHSIRTNGPFIPEGTSTTDTLSQHQSPEGTSAISEARTTRSTISSFNAPYTGFTRDYLQLKFYTSPLLAPQPFQCTFCLRQYSNKNDWLRHEELAHFQEREWIKTIDGSIRGGSASTEGSIYSMDSIHRVPQRRSSIYSSRCSYYGESSNQKSLQSIYSWFWVCGFCSDVLRSWDERQEHIAEHFENGMTMACWDPLKSPYPWIRSSVTPVQGLPRWDLKELFAIQRRSLIDLLNG